MAGMMKIGESALGNWFAAQPADAAAWLAEVKAPWWIAGGWALDLFLGETLRVHGDLDVGVLRRDLEDVLVGLPLWEHFAARDGALSLLKPGELTSEDVHSLWCRPVGATSWALELMLDESDGEFWLFRRQLTIRRPLSTLTRSTESGIRYLAPEIQLLYKAKAIRPSDQADFERTAPQLDLAARDWLRDSLAKTSPGHLWLAALERQPVPNTGMNRRPARKADRKWT
jgi:hypothetical protein